jgi:hypothetical protein
MHNELLIGGPPGLVAYFASVLNFLDREKTGSDGQQNRHTKSPDTQLGSNAP